MKLWRIEACDHRYARASHVGTWVDVGEPPQSVRVKPLIIEWEPGSTVIGDFTWVGTYSYMISRVAAEELLAAGFRGFELGPVEMRPNQDFARRKQNMIQLPYVRQELVDFYVIRKDVSFNRARSTVRVVGQDGGRPVYEVDGDERFEDGDWHPESGELDRVHIPRTPGMGVYVNSQDVSDVDVFVIDELRMGPFCTSRLREFILTKGYTNITFFEAGEVID